MKKRGIALVVILIALLASCGGGGGATTGNSGNGGGGGGSVTTEPTPMPAPTTFNPVGIAKDTRAYSSRAEVIGWSTATETRRYNVNDPHNREKLLQDNPELDGAYVKNGIETPIQVGIVDIGFNLTNPDFVGMFEDRFGTGVNNRLQLVYGPGVNGQPGIPKDPEFGGLLATEILAGGYDKLGILKKAKIVAADPTVEAGGNYVYKPTVKMFQEMEKIMGGSTAVYSLHYGNGSMADYAAAPSTDYLTSGGLLGGKELLNEYIRLTKEGKNRLFVWAAGDDENKMNPSVEAGLPKFVPETENSWINVVGLTQKTDVPGVSENQFYYIDPTGVKVGYYDQLNALPGTILPNNARDIDWSNLRPLTRAGEAAIWSVSALADFVSEYTYGYYLTARSSNAAATVAGTAVLLKEKYPGMEARLIRQSILTTAVDIGEPGVDDAFGWGFLDMEKALKGPARFDKRLIRNDIYDRDRVIVNVPDSTSMIGYNKTWVFENDISGDAGLRKTGNGTLELTGNLTYTGETWVQNGILKIKGKVYNSGFKSSGGASTLSLHKNALVKSIINEGSNVEIAGEGVTISEDYKATPDSKTTFNLGANVHVKGKTELDGSKIELTSLKDEEAQYITAKGIETEIIKSDNGISGNFSEVETSEMLEGKVETDEDEGKVTAILSRKNVEEYATKLELSDSMTMDVAENTEATFKALDAEIEKGNLADVKKFASAAAHLQAMALSKDEMDKLSGHIYGSAQALTFQHSQTVNKDLSNRLVMLGTLDNVGDNAGLWITGIGARGKIKQDGFGSGNTNIFGGQVGIDRKFGDFILGAALSYSTSEAKFDRYGGKSTGDGFGISLYGRYDADIPVYLQGRLGMGFITSKVERDIMLTDVTSQRGKIEHKDKVFSGYLETGYDAEAGGFVITPYIGISHDTVSRGSFTEENSQFGLTAPKATFKQTSGHIGLRVGKSVGWSGGSKTTFQGYISHQAAFNKEDLSFEASYTGLSGARFTVKGIGLSRHQTWGGIGILTEVNPNFAWYINYDGKLSKKGNNNIFTTGFRLNF